MTTPPVVIIPPPWWMTEPNYDHSALGPQEGGTADGPHPCSTTDMVRVWHASTPEEQAQVVADIEAEHAADGISANGEPPAAPTDGAPSQGLPGGIPPKPTTPEPKRAPPSHA